ncbi:MAG: hypothetical protein E7052_10565 [Lentisphaerae bacterium]|nr:hypothetical protein [Lentisphaerota bacterium]
MDIAYKTFLAILETFIAFGLGAYLTRRKILDQNGIAQLSNLTLDLLFPLLTISSITRNFKTDQLLDAWILPVMGFAIMFAGMMLGRYFSKLMKYGTRERRAMFQHFCTCNNYLFLPLIVLDNLWGERYVSLLLLMNIGSTIGFWTLGIAAFGGSSRKETLRNIFSVNLYSVLIALGFVIFHIPMPQIVGKVCATMGNAAVPLVLIGIGAAIYNSAGRFGEHLTDVFYLSLVRLVLLPVIFILIMKLLPIPEDIFRVLAVVALMPVSSSSVLVARRYGGDMDLASQAIIITTILSIITAPLLLKILL